MRARRVVLPARRAVREPRQSRLGKTTRCTLVLEILFPSLVAGIVVVCLRRTRGCQKMALATLAQTARRPHRRAPWRRNARGRGRPRRSLRLRRRGLTMVTPPGPTTRTRRSSSTRRRGARRPPRVRTRRSRSTGRRTRRRPFSTLRAPRPRPGPIARRRQSAPARTRARTTRCVACFACRATSTTISSSPPCVASDAAAAGTARRSARDPPK